ncbi:MAG: hypothetical protein ACLGHS_08305 [Actinomycetes bacterium]
MPVEVTQDGATVYKDTDVVMEDARDLVRVRHTLRQIVNVKGD